MRTGIWCIGLLLIIGEVFGQDKEAVPAPVLKTIADAQPAGNARYSYLFWDIYHATLFAPHGKWQASEPFALSLTYLREFDGEDIAKRSVKEMRAQGLSDSQLEQRWQAKMAELFPDVVAQDTITGLVTQNRTTRFYHNDQWLGEIQDPTFTEWFFNIWLGPNTTEPDFRAELLQQESSK